LIALCLGVFMTQLDTTAVNLALPSIRQELGGDVHGLQWVVDAYNLVFATLLLTGGLLGDRYGRKRVFLAGLAVFTAGSLLCAVAPTQPVLVVGRAVQGMGAAAELPATLAILTATFADAVQRARAVASWASMAGLALAVGPTVGALMIDRLDWESIFLLNVPLGAAAFILAASAIPRRPPRRDVGLDLPGQACFALGLAALTYAAIGIHTLGGRDPRVLVAVIASVGSLTGFLLVERRSDRPMVPISFFRNRNFSIAVANAALMTFGMYGMLFVTSLYLQSARGGSALLAGVELLPMSVAFIGVSQLGGRLRPRIGPRWLMGGGMGCMGAGLLGLSSVTTATGYPGLCAGFIIIGVGLGLNTATVVGTAVDSAPGDKAGVAAGLVNAARLVGAALGVAVLGGLLPPDVVVGSDAFMAGVRMAFAIGGAAILFGAALAVVRLEPRRLGRRRCGAVADQR
jgi:EmrB/QacA subfamily drug resistance transporter